MRRTTLILSLLLPALAAAADQSITATEVAPGVYMLSGPGFEQGQSGGNVGLVVGDEATFVVDDKYGELSQAVLDTVAELSERPVDFILNTHYHGDHTGGNHLGRAAGAWILAHHNVPPRVAADERQPPSAVPVISYAESMIFRINGMEVRVEHRARSHTDGDSIVFLGDDVIHAGDTLFNGLFPYIDVDGGGRIDGVIGTLRYILEQMDRSTVVIAGHGPLADRAALQENIAMLETSRARVAEALDQGLSADEMVAQDLLGDYTEDYSWGFIDTERFTRSIVASLTSGG